MATQPETLWGVSGFFVNKTPLFSPIAPFLSFFQRFFMFSNVAVTYFMINSSWNQVAFPAAV